MKERFCVIWCQLLMFATVMLVPLSAFAQSSFHQFTPNRSILNFNLDFFGKGIYHPTEPTVSFSMRLTRVQRRYLVVVLPL